MLPITGLSDHVTDVLDVPVTIALNWSGWDGPSEAVGGQTARL
jgi:hypothetical protein